MQNGWKSLTTMAARDSGLLACLECRGVTGRYWEQGCPACQRFKARSRPQRTAYDVKQRTLRQLYTHKNKNKNHQDNITIHPIQFLAFSRTVHINVLQSKTMENGTQAGTHTMPTNEPSYTHTHKTIQDNSISIHPTHIPVLARIAYIITTETNIFQSQPRETGLGWNLIHRKKPKIINLSYKSISATKIDILSEGLKFPPTPHKIS